ncbi:MAG: hypothetical protein K9N35_05475 [Candidatus Marinimicrobia bacterium]|nr:hypothetical protein [Candidatus Neomarinimicrobiota bacterium]
MITILCLCSSLTEVFAVGLDSLSYNYRQDNLSTMNDLNFNHVFQFDKSAFELRDILRYKLFDQKNISTGNKQYSIEHKLQGDILWGRDRNRNLRLETSQYEDHRTGLASTIDNWAFLGGLNVKDLYSLYFGGRSVERYGIVDQGWTSELDLHRSWRTNAHYTNLAISGQKDELDEHSNHHVNAQAEYQIRFAQISTLRSSFQIENRRQEFFTDPLGSSQLRKNQNIVWQNHFTYNLGKELRLFHDLNWGDQMTEIKQEKIEEGASISLRGEERKRLSLVNESGLMLDRPNFSTLTAFKVENSQNKYYIDYTQILYQLREDIVWNIPGIVDSLSWNNTLSRLEYDTPDTTNDDDRDEWRLKTELSLKWRPSPFYSVELGSNLSLFHLIYLFNTRSSENYWNRNLVFWTEFKWIRNSWSGEGGANIRSNYFDYDYDELFIEADQASRSFVHRSLDLRKQITYRFNRRLSIVSKIATRWEDEGQLNWVAFIEQVSSEREQIELSSKLSLDYRGWNAWLGYLTHRRETQYSVLNRDPDHWYGKGPLFGVSHQLGSRLYVNLDARIISVEDQDRSYQLPRIFFSLAYH